MVIELFTEGEFNNYKCKEYKDYNIQVFFELNRIEFLLFEHIIYFIH